VVAGLDEGSEPRRRDEQVRVAQQLRHLVPLHVAVQPVAPRTACGRRTRERRAWSSPSPQGARGRSRGHDPRRRSSRLDASAERPLPECSYDLAPHGCDRRLRGPAGAGGVLVRRARLRRRRRRTGLRRDPVPARRGPGPADRDPRRRPSSHPRVPTGARGQVHQEPPPPRRLPGRQQPGRRGRAGPLAGRPARRCRPARDRFLRRPARPRGERVLRPAQPRARRAHRSGRCRCRDQLRRRRARSRRPGRRTRGP
jgi:hypothetical protein